jgi:hypothetical protein
MCCPSVVNFFVCWPKLWRPKENVNKLTNIRYSTSQQQYLDSVSSFQHLAGWTPLRKFFLVQGLFYKEIFSYPLLDWHDSHYGDICYTLRIWLHSRITFCPLDWRSTIHWNVVLAFFQHNHICQDCWKNTRSTFECMVILKSREEGPKKLENYGTKTGKGKSLYRPWHPP